MGFLFLVPLLLFVAAQGAVIFMTACWGLRLFKTSHWLGKTAAMAASYVAWVALTITGYILLGGDGGFMKGFGLVLILCFTAMVSAFVYWLCWLLRTPRETREEKFFYEPFS